MHRLILLFAFWLATHCVYAAAIQTPHAEVELVAGSRHARPGHPLTVALRLVHEPGWHTYWRNPGDSGMPTRIAWRLPDGMTAGPILWPVPHRISVGPLTNYGYDGEALLLTEIAVPADWKAGVPLMLEARADWLICKEICLPGGASLSLQVPTANGAPALDPRWGKAIGDGRRALPVTDGRVRPTVELTDRHIALDFVITSSATASALDRVEFFPNDPEIIDNPSPQILEKHAGGYRLLLTAAPTFKGTLKELTGLLVATPGFFGPGGTAHAIAFSAAYPGGVPPKPASPTGKSAPMSAEQIRAAAGSLGSPVGLIAALALAFVGGLILNLMPCVFPVVSIKILGFVDQAHGDRGELRRHGLAFAAGILVCFWFVAGLLLAFRAGGQALGWGYQLQSPPVVAGLAVLFFLLGLNLSGYFEIGARVQTLAGDVRTREGLGGAFLSGVLATVVATPCTAPFMGAALGFALTQPPVSSLAVFTSLALGMGLPYVLLTLIPALAGLLPRPGRWMESLKQLLAFPLYLTVVWLVWVLGQQSGVTASARLLVALVMLLAAIWAWRRFGGGARWGGSSFAAALTVGAVVLAWPDPQAGSGKPGADIPMGWVPYSDDALETARAAGPVFVDFTDAWCVTCQVNKRVVLDRPDIVQAFEARNVVRMRADWTRRDEHITAALGRLGRSGVPVYALYAKGNSTPELLPELLTRDTVLTALEHASTGQR